MEFSQSFVVYHIVLKWCKGGLFVLWVEIVVFESLPLFGDCVDGILPDGSLTEAHKMVTNEKQKGYVWNGVQYTTSLFDNLWNHTVHKMLWG